MQRVLAVRLHQAGAIMDRRTRAKNNPDGLGFRLKLHEKQPDAPLSPYFLNLRTPENPKPGPLTPDIIGVAAGLMLDIVQQLGLEYQCIAGVPNAGDPFAEAIVALHSPGTVSLIKLGKAEGAEGRQVIGIISGEFKRGDACLVVDDLITQANSKLEALRALDEAGLRVMQVVVLVDREQGGAVQLADHGIDLLAAYQLSTLFELYRQQGLMPEEIFAEAMAYLQQEKAATQRA